MNDGLLDAVCERLGHAPLAGLAENLLLAALEGEAALEEACSGGEPRLRREALVTAGGQESVPAQAYLLALTVEGFRGVGPACRLELHPGPGLTVVCGRNGSGKSSFAEAAEILFTGRLRRWDDHSAVWKAGWRCMHAPGRTIVGAELSIEGVGGVTTVTREWAADAKEPDQSEAWVQRPGERRAGIEGLGWVEALESYRPFLSHAELEALLAKPKDLYDQLNALLGLDDLEAASQLLARARRDADRPVKSEKESRAELNASLGTCTDERAVRASALLGTREPDTEALATLAVGGEADDGRAMAVLGQLRDLDMPEREEVLAATSGLRDAATALTVAASVAASDAVSDADLLEAALAHYQRHGPGDCPVCGEADRLDERWRAAVQDRLEVLRQTGKALATARQVASEAMGVAVGMVRETPAVVARAGEVGVDAAGVVAAWAAWSSLVMARVVGTAAGAADNSSAELEAFAVHLDETYSPLAAAVDAMRGQAALAIEARQAAWAPFASQIERWCALSGAATAAVVLVAGCKQAETWLKTATAEIRNDQLRPFADETVRLWAQLRQQSSVELQRMSLSGAGNRSHVDFEVTVDGAAAAGLGVMSQGEVNALALSVFLPRATSPQSPLRFVLIDDPVQAMDPAKVAGLARVLAEVGERRQVVVFTHDDRLTKAISDLGLPARIVAVQRRADSVVELSDGGDPCAALLKDAGALAAGDRVPLEAALHVVPGLCRTALETACLEMARRRRLRRGETMEQVEESLAAVQRLLAHLALAVFDDPERAGDVYDWLGNRCGRWAVQAVKECNLGSHHDLGIEALRELVGASRRLVERLRRVST